MPRKSKTAVETLSADAVRAAINKQFGPGAAKLANDPSLQITRVPTGVLAVDYMLSGGFPRNRYVEIYGQPDVGKTALTYRLLANAQGLGLSGAFCDVEGTFDPVFAHHLGVDLSSLEFSHKSHGNQVVDYMMTLLMAGNTDVLVMDSIAALLPKAELEGSTSDATYGTAQAKLMSEALRKLTTVNKNTVLVFINQLRENVGAGPFGQKWRTSGGRAMPFYAGIRLEMVLTETLYKTGKVIDHKSGKSKASEKIPRGHRALIRVMKDKTGSARRGEETTVVFDYDQLNFDPIEDLLYVGRVTDLVHLDSKERWWVDGYEDEKKRGRPAFKKWLRRNVAIAEELEERIREGDWPEDDEEVDEDEA